MRLGDFFWEFLRQVSERNIDCLLIGRQALVVYGSPVTTQDVDLLLATPEEETAAGKLAEDFGLQLSHREENNSWLSGRRRLVIYRDDPAFTIGPLRRLDILNCQKLGKVVYTEASARACRMEVEPGFIIKVPHIDDLIELKRAAGRPKDISDIHWLRAHRQEILDHLDRDVR